MANFMGHVDQDLIFILFISKKFAPSTLHFEISLYIKDSNYTKLPMLFEWGHIAAGL